MQKQSVTAGDRPNHAAAEGDAAGRASLGVSGREGDPRGGSVDTRLAGVNRHGGRGERPGGAERRQRRTEARQLTILREI
ncbi:hypothetical protein LNKW23_04330 [Paralimibaculum aggregatum]|uniref:Uncharacterized protein n=1 Tax=Paralimibaculum aggregatum TaxID=3036245 RepID=A0ABQ6LFP0_9RHOB|nr:hypothetical protein LNKW23_04330 [Limibaculum sp. NKW23]